MTPKYGTQGFPDSKVISSTHPPTHSSTQLQKAEVPFSQEIILEKARGRHCHQSSPFLDRTGTSQTRNNYLSKGSSRAFLRCPVPRNPLSIKLLNLIKSVTPNVSYSEDM